MITDFQALFEISKTFGFKLDTLTPQLVISFVLYLFISKHFDKRFDEIDKRLDKVEKAIVEIQAVLVNKLKVVINYPIHVK